MRLRGRPEGELRSAQRKGGCVFACRRIGVAALALVLGLAVDAVEAARVGVLSNRYSSEAAADFNSRLAGHAFTGVDVSGAAPTLATLTSSYDVLLIFADQNFANAPAVGNVAAEFANTGRPVVLGTFYDQQRSDAGGSGWGALETLDPNTTDGLGVPQPLGWRRTLDGAATVPHPLTQLVTTLFGNQWAGGNEAKPGTTVVARWLEPNARGNPDPAIAYRTTGAACVVQIGIAPHYSTLGTFGAGYGGEFYRAWQNGFDFAAKGCRTGDAVPVPALSDFALGALALGLAAIALHERRRRTFGR